MTGCRSGLAIGSPQPQTRLRPPGHWQGTLFPWLGCLPMALMHDTSPLFVPVARSGNQDQRFVPQGNLFRISVSASADAYDHLPLRFDHVILNGVGSTPPPPCPTPNVWWGRCRRGEHQGPSPQPAPPHPNSGPQVLSSQAPGLQSLAQGSVALAQGLAALVPGPKANGVWPLVPRLLQTGAGGRHPEVRLFLLEPPRSSPTAECLAHPQSPAHRQPPAGLRAKNMPFPPFFLSFSSYFPHCPRTFPALSSQFPHFPPISPHFHHLPEPVCSRP